MKRMMENARFRRSVYAGGVAAAVVALVALGTGAASASASADGIDDGGQSDALDISVAAEAAGDPGSAAGETIWVDSSEVTGDTSSGTDAEGQLLCLSARVPVADDDAPDGSRVLVTVPIDEGATACPDPGL